MKVRILDVPISRLDLDGALAFCLLRYAQRLGGYFCFANVHTVVEARKSLQVREAMARATLAFADGKPLAWIAHLRGQPVASRVSGPDFMHEFLKRSPELPHVLVGGGPGVAHKVARKYEIASNCFSPPLREFSPANVEDDLASLRTISGSIDGKIVWVGLGAPKQELWMEHASRLSPQTQFFGVGAAFDFLAGTKKRAPVWMQRFGIEWFHRFTQEPGRLAERYLRTNVAFIVELIRDIIKGR